MKKALSMLQLISCLLLLFPSALAQISSTCVSATFSNKRVFASCRSLPHLGASLHWTYHPSNASLDIAYRAPQSPSGWVAWALNPSGAGMIGAQALLAFPSPSFPSSLTVYTTSLSSYVPTVRNESLSFKVHDRSADYSDGAITIFATLDLPNNNTNVNHVWQAGTHFISGLPAGHATTGDNIRSSGSLDLLSGASTAAAGAN